MGTLIIYECDKCKGVIHQDKPHLSIFGQHGLSLSNSLDEARMLEYSPHDKLLFCSKKCFVNFFFEDES